MDADFVFLVPRRVTRREEFDRGAGVDESQYGLVFSHEFVEAAQTRDAAWLEVEAARKQFVFCRGLRRLDRDVGGAAKRDVDYGALAFGADEEGRREVW